MLSINLIFFGGAGDGPGLIHSKIVKSKFDDAFSNPSKIGLGGVNITPESEYFEWSDAAFGRDKAFDHLSGMPTSKSTQTVVVGHSYGAEAAMRTCKRMTSPINHLVTIDAVSWQSKFFWDSKPANVREWTNVYVSGISTDSFTGFFNDLVATVGGHWGKRDAADRNYDTSKRAIRGGHRLNHGSFLGMWNIALPHVRKSLGI